MTKPLETLISGKGRDLNLHTYTLINLLSLITSPNCSPHHLLPLAGDGI